MSDVYGPMLSSRDVEEHIHDTIALWVGTYLAQWEYLTDRVLAPPRSYVVSPVLDKFNEDQVPAVIIHSPGLERPPELFGDGLYAGWWGMVVGVVCEGMNRDNTNQLCKDYATIMRTLLLQKGAGPSGDEGLVSAVRWSDESYDEIDDAPARTLGVSAVGFSVLVEGAVNRLLGPPEPITPPGAPLFRMTSWKLNVIRVAEVP